LLLVEEDTANDIHAEEYQCISPHWLDSCEQHVLAHSWHSLIKYWFNDKYYINKDIMFFQDMDKRTA